MKRTCKSCSKPVFGRTDKVFCSIYCKNQHHIALRQTIKNSAFAIDEQLHKNYAILQNHLGKRKTTLRVDKEELRGQKFRFKYHTHSQGSEDKQIKFLYDIGWMESENNSIKIIRKG